MRWNVAHLLSVFLLCNACSWSHESSRACTPPNPKWGKPHPHLGPVILTISLAVDHAGQAFLNGKAISRQQLATNLTQIGKLENPEPAVVLETEMGVPCETINEVRSLMDQELHCEHEGHCDEGVRAIWENLPYTGSGVP